MKIVFFYIILFFVSTLNAQGICKIVTDEETQKPMLMGSGGVEAFKDTNFSKWFNKEYSNYKINTEDISGLFDDSLDFCISIVAGTWCSDSRREIPRFIKILDTLKYSLSNVNLFFVNREKKGLDNEVDSLSIKLVPTIIFYRDDKELGRITEAPEETLEKDLQKIVGRNK